MQISELKRKSQRFKVDSTDILPLAFVGLSVATITLSFGTIWLGISFARLAAQKPPTLVQQVDGKAFTVRPMAYSYREPEVIRRTVSDWAVMTFTWGKPPGSEKGQLDEGKEVGAGKQERIPTAAWEAAFLLAPDFRDTFMKQLATEIVPQDVFRGQVAAVLVPQNFSNPEAAGDGRWRVDMVATRIVFDNASPAGRSVPFNRTFFVKAMPPPQNPLANPTNDYQRVIYSMLERGVQIEEIRPIEREVK
jgi:hypothetical protein